MDERITPTTAIEDTHCADKFTVELEGFDPGAISTMSERADLRLPFIDVGKTEAVKHVVTTDRTVTVTVVSISDDFTDTTIRLTDNDVAGAATFTTKVWK